MLPSQRSIIVLVAALLLGLVGAEAYVRLASPVPVQDLLPLPYPRTDLARLDVGDSYVQFDAVLGWSPGHGASALDDGILYRANQAGLRADREFPREAPAGLRRIAAFGDSFVHCDEVNYADCWTARLETEWSGSELLDFGIPASAPDQGWLRYERDGRAYHPCAVLIGFPVENVNRVVNRFRPFYTPQTGIALSKPRYVLDGDGLRLLPNPVSSADQLNDPAWVEQQLGPHDFWYFPGIFASDPFDAFALVRLGRTAHYQRFRASLQTKQPGVFQLAQAYTPGDERFEVTTRVLEGFARSAEADGASAVVVLMGKEQEVVSVRHRQARGYESLVDALKAAGVAAVDVTDDLAREANRSGVSGLFSRGGHYSPRGNQIVAAALAKRLPPLIGSTCP
ncbi:MAG: hypothetical protein IT305_07135 [Chloroflexi bacterium]|nr:hypothetical protein [Chloroflexota bacterium]